MKNIRISNTIKLKKKAKVFAAMSAPRKSALGKAVLISARKQRVFVAMSGGVDSSLSAALLKGKDYDVTGVFIKVWQPDFVECVWKEDRLDAMRVCAKLGIKFLTLDLEKEYKREVVDYMIREYKAGRTPNPDVNCNKYVKFGAFFDFAMKSGADYVATGHYARLRQKIKNQKSKIKIYELAVARDKNKDQSYFLWNLTQEHLKRTLFPVGNLQKTEVRKMARKFNLPVSEKKDSQGLCFIGKIDMKDFLKHYLPPKKGNVLNDKGEVIGWHEGAYFYTIGQRHGFITTKKSPEDKSYYIISKDILSNTITVSHNPISQGVSSSKRIIISGVNWTTGTPPNLNKKYKARIRYREVLQSCHIEMAKEDHSNFLIIFDLPQAAVSRGQSLVIYEGENCIGGGVIDNFE
ncbi:MAG: tRNA (5-methylaminomethyl-2-thiouridylate)-methyltransferase, tRNA-specific 2-thiouridylase [Parcubacteria group bacterium]|nr:tRNA (5-methylaminomethyl-2-thiouridylate)-methyltransferase, tRNA-specific 2-thiouridylase [Parcubacteria group bacterium]